MDNTIIEDGKEYYLEKVWRRYKTDNKKDSKGNLFPYPKKGENGTNYKDIIDRIEFVNSLLLTKGNFTAYSEPMSCHICKHKNIANGMFTYRNIKWEDSLIHYVTKHGIKPSTAFVDFIFKEKFDKIIKRLSRNKKQMTKEKKMVLHYIVKDNNKYVKIARNQILIFDALMDSGGYNKKYIDNKKNFKRYSEHAGLLDFDKDRILQKIVVSGITNRVDSGDDEIYLPIDLDEIFDYEYIFHTHPPTPKPGGRAVDGVLYEFPSLGDIFHFIDHHNEGNVIGSIVITPEGLYNIRKHDKDSKGDIDIDEDKLYHDYQRNFYKFQDKEIEHYGEKFSKKYFYSVIAQDTSFTDNMNDVLNKYNIHVDYYPRKNDKKDKSHWYIDDVYLIFTSNKITKKKSRQKLK